MSKILKYAKLYRNLNIVLLVVVNILIAFSVFYMTFLLAAFGAQPSDTVLDIILASMMVSIIMIVVYNLCEIPRIVFLIQSNRLITYIKHVECNKEEFDVKLFLKYFNSYRRFALFAMWIQVVVIVLQLLNVLISIMIMGEYYNFIDFIYIAILFLMLTIYYPLYKLLNLNNIKSLKKQ